jgi:hypothetical protein
MAKRNDFAVFAGWVYYSGVVAMVVVFGLVLYESIWG